MTDLLTKLRTVRQTAAALRRGEISEQTIRPFVHSLAAEYQEGRALPGDLAFGAVAVALEQAPTSYGDLARLRLAEMPVNTRVARECLRAMPRLAVGAVGQ